MKVALLYTIFAALATIANIAGQYTSIRLYPGPWPVEFSMLVGTAVGLVLKYWLDKNWIFRYQTTSTAHDTRTFIIYTAMGIITTAIFWGFELWFEYLFKNETMRYVGGIIGLAIGYITKYFLDKKFVFT